MSTDQLNPFQVPASADLSASVYCGVTVDTSGNLALPAANAGIVGILYNKPTALAAPGKVMGFGSGIVKAVYGGTVTAGDDLKVTSAGKFVTASASDVTSGFKVAKAVNSGSSNDVGRIILTGTGTASISGEETITTGAASLSLLTTLLSTTGTIAYTLANGTYTGQRKVFEEITAATTPLGTLTITTPAGSEPATHVFTAIGQRIEFEWNGTGWHCIAKRRAGRQAVVVGTTVLTGLDMCMAYDLSVTGTQHSTTTKGIPGGLVPGERIFIDVLTAATIPVGDIAITAKTTVGVAATSYAHLNGTDTNLTAEWDGAAWQAQVFVAGGSAVATLS